MKKYEELNRQLANTVDLAEQAVLDLKAGITTDEEAEAVKNNELDVNNVRTLILNAGLALELFEWGYSVSDTFDDCVKHDGGTLGTNLLYLVGAVLQNKTFASLPAENMDFLKLLGNRFDQDHEIWKFITEL